ncbi:Rossmann-like domain-containing protein [Hippea jasoniae]|uniref:Rossmann-like domain-containing protein n=1 Tax=Hippea jasoniae TaxID=944479 RepID=UPI000550BD38|nr:DUF364 domain-containing protein [Hippea jasoniae]
MSYIHQKIFEKTIETAKELEVKDVRIGLGYTIVELDNNTAGLSYSFTKELNITSCSVVDEAGSLTGKKASYLIEKIFSYNLLDSSIALAAANAIINSNIESKDIDIVKFIKPTDKVVMIGYFGPLVEAIEAKTEKFVICERSVRGKSLPDYAAYFELQDADIAIITATSIINKTIDALLKLPKKARIVAIMGPSAPMDLEIFSAATHVCGSKVRDIKLAKQIISEGGGTRKLKPALSKHCVFKEAL